MKYLTSQYTPYTKSLDLYFAGCKAPHCVGCHNPESHSFDLGMELTPKQIFEAVKFKIDAFSGLVDSVMLFGGEPLHQNHEELEELLNLLASDKRNISIWLFTRYEIEEVPFPIRIKCNFIKTGRYEEASEEGGTYYGIKLASINQKILKRGVDY